MKIGIVANMLHDKPLGEALEYYRSLGIEAAEIGCGGYPGKAHADPEELLANRWELKKFKDTMETSGLSISAFACHGNPVHPDRELAAGYHRDMCDAARLAG